MSEQRSIYGIDLGTTYSVVAYIDETGRSAVVHRSDGDDTTLSVVYFESAGNAVVGRAAGQVVITVPAYFGLLEKDATKKPGDLVGLGATAIVPEPVTAALAYAVTGSADGSAEPRKADRLAGSMATLITVTRHQLEEMTSIQACDRTARPAARAGLHGCAMARHIRRAGRDDIVIPPSQARCTAAAAWQARAADPGHCAKKAAANPWPRSKSW